MDETPMVERVARAMVLSWGGDPDTTETASSALPRPKMWEIYAGQASAAIETVIDEMARHARKDSTGAEAAAAFHIVVNWLAARGDLSRSQR